MQDDISVRFDFGVFPKGTKPIAPFHCEHIPKVRAAPQFKWFYYSRVFDDFDIDVMMMMSTRSAEFVVRSCAAPPPSPSDKPWKQFFGSGVTRGRFIRYISLKQIFVGGMRRDNATTDAAVGTALAVVG